MPRGKPKGADGAAKISGMEAVRRTVKELGYDVKTQTAHNHILAKYGLDLSNNKISAYKSKERRDAGLTRSKGGRPAGRSGPAGIGALQIHDVQAIKELVGRLGAGRVRDLIAVLD